MFDRKIWKRMAQVFVIFALYIVLYLWGSGGAVGQRVTMFFFMYFSYVLVNATIVLKREPELARARGDMGKAEGWDKAIMVIYTALLFAVFYFAGVDSRGASVHFEGFYLAAAILFFTASCGVLTWSFMANKFFESGARIQKDRHQVVVTKGPYAFVRHPGYAAMMVFLVSWPVIMDSPSALWVSFALVALLAVRTYLEDRMLMNGLNGYRVYARKVRYRLVPRLW